jgi:hypothetical protein
MTWPVLRGRIAVPLEVRAAAMITGAIVEIVLVRAAAEPESELIHRSRRPAERGGARVSRGP